MKVTVRLFASLREQAGMDRLEVELPPGATVDHLTTLLSESYPVLKEVLERRKVLISLNQEMANKEDILKEGDEAGLLPPFSGGCND